MRKISLLTSAIAAVLFGASSAKADVSVSGSGGMAIASGNDTTQLINGAAVVFALSSDLGNGVVVSTSSSLSMDSNDSVAIGAGAGGFKNLDFAMGGASISFGSDIDIAGDGVGEVGGVATDHVDNAGYNTAFTGMGGLTQEDGYGVSFTSDFGGATVTASYLLETENSNNVAQTDQTDTAAGVTVSIPVGAMSITLGASTDDKNNQSQSGGEVSMALAGGSITAGMAATTDSDSGAADTETYGLEYSTSVGGASVAVGYTNGKSGSSKSQRTEVNVSQSIGTGASIFLDIQNGTGGGTTSGGTNIAVGTTFTF
jgi:hypothetical protein|tara:strand:- start:500 stop:1441 length:942 start_codon:yes stop_codon:yes gene_type:complete